MIDYEVSTHQQGILIIVYDKRYVHFMTSSDKREYMKTPSSMRTSTRLGVYYDASKNPVDRHASQPEFDWYTYNNEQIRNTCVQCCNGVVWEILECFVHKRPFKPEWSYLSLLYNDILHISEKVDYSNSSEVALICSPSKKRKIVEDECNTIERTNKRKKSIVVAEKINSDAFSQSSLFLCNQNFHTLSFSHTRLTFRRHTIENI